MSDRYSSKHETTPYSKFRNVPNLGIEVNKREQFRKLLRLRNERNKFACGLEIVEGSHGCGNCGSTRVFPVNDVVIAEASGKALMNGTGVHYSCQNKRLLLSTLESHSRDESGSRSEDG